MHIASSNHYTACPVQPRPRTPQSQCFGASLSVSNFHNIAWFPPPPREREGWVFHYVAQTTLRGAMADQITFTLPGHTQQNPVLYTESLREPISKV